jgi:hypothetical protein
MCNETIPNKMLKETDPSTTRKPSCFSPTQCTPTLQKLGTVKVLSIIWLSLCASLVKKRNELILIFFSFSASFITAFLISGISLASIISILKDSNNNHLTTKQRDKNVLTKAQIGLMTSASSAIYLTLQSTIETLYPETFTSSTGGGGGPLRRELLLTSPVFLVLCINAGYLAFDLWFDAIFCRLRPSRFISTIEDASTLSFLCVILARWDELGIPSKTSVQHGLFLHFLLVVL